MKCKYAEENDKQCRACVCANCVDTERCEYWGVCVVDECDGLPGSQGRYAIPHCDAKDGVKLANGEVEFLYKVREVQDSGLCGNNW